MSSKEMTRWAVMRRVRDKTLSLGDAATVLRLSYRQARRIFRRFRATGQQGLVHGNVGQRSNHAHPATVRARAVALIREHFSGTVRGRGQRFGPTLAAEHLTEEFGLIIAVPTLRRWMLAEKLWSRMRTVKRHRRRRMRRAHFGELVQLDGSFHDWLETGVVGHCLLTMIDDATGRTLGSFTGEETTWGAAALLQRWIALHGVPRALYVDAKNVFVRPGTTNELAAGIAPVTQFGRMCAKLGIQMIVAKSPEAKGRVERVHGTNQDRLVKKLRRQRIGTYDAANTFLHATYWAAHNARFAVAPAAAADFHLPLEPRLDLAHVFCLEEPRIVGNDWVVRYDNRALQILPTPRAKRYTNRKARILVRETVTGEIFLVARSTTDGDQCLDWTLATPSTRAACVAPAPVRPVPPVTPAAGYTRSGKPLSAKQMAVRARWSSDVQRRIHHKRQGQALVTTPLE